MIVDRRAILAAIPALAFAPGAFAAEANENIVYLDTKDGRITI